MKPFSLILVVLLFSLKTSAQINIQTFRPSSSSEYQSLEGALPSGAEKSRVSLNYNWMDQPLISINRETLARQANIVDNIQTFDLGSKFLILPRLSFSANLPIHNVQLINQERAFAMGDASVSTKYRFTPTKDRFGFFLMPTLNFPTGSESYYVSNKGMSGEIRIGGDYIIGRGGVVANLGYRRNPGAKLDNVDFSNQIVAGVGGYLTVSPRMILNTELTRLSSTSKQASFSGQTELTLGGRYRLAPNTSLSGGLGLRGFDNKDFGNVRILVGLQFFPKDDGISSSISDQMETSLSAPIRCRKQPFTASFLVRRLNETEMKNVSKNLPYRSTDKHSFPALQIGDLTGYSKEGIPYVKDSQVVFAVDVTDLPPRSDVDSLHSAQLNLSVTKLSQDRHPKTEMLCYLNGKVCSGKSLTGEKWRSNKTSKNSDQTRNRAFTQLYLNNPVKVDSPNSKKVYSSEIQFDLSSLFPIQKSQNAIDLLYDKNNPGKKTLYFAITDDTHVSAANARLNVQMSENHCNRTL